MIRAFKFLPELSHVQENGENPIFVTETGRIGCIFELPVLDLEARDADRQVSAMDRLINSLPDGLIARFIQRAKSSTDVGYESYRTKAISEISFVERHLLMSVERDAGDPLSFKSILGWIRGKGDAAQAASMSLLSSLPRHELSEIGARSLSASEIQKIFSLPEAQVAVADCGIDYGDHLTSVLRLYKPGTKTITDTTLASLIDQLPLPFEVYVSVRKMARHKADFKLRSQLAKGEVVRDVLTAAKQEATEKVLTETAMFGATLCELEWLLVLRRTDESGLRHDLEKARTILGEFGDVMIETVGSVPSYVASRIGSGLHHTFLEENCAVPLYLPVFAYGETLDRGIKRESRTCLVHRLDGSLHSYDQFSKKFLAYNSIICGKTGSGKSVLANALSSALMQDPSVRMIKIDVGGSYKKECEAFQGREVSFKLDAPAGVNPFAIIGDVAGSNEAVDVVAEFIATLIREEGEVQIPKSMRAEVEEKLKAYVAHNGRKYTIDDFIAQAKTLPRKNLLARWATGGVFENALKERVTTTANEQSERYRYYNFENIQSAANRDFAEGVMAAVITMINLEMLKLGDRTRGQAGERLVLFCDETKFFIDRFSQFFLLTAANFRKFGHGLVLMLQNIRNAEVRLPDGTFDRGLILNSPIRFFLQADTEAEYLTSQFQFDEDHLRVVVTHPYRGREYREAVLQDDTGTRVIRLYLTDEEYWRMTSTREDVEKYKQLRAAVPNLSVEEAIRCLAATNGR